MSHNIIMIRCSTCHLSFSMMRTRCSMMQATITYTYHAPMICSWLDAPLNCHYVWWWQDSPLTDSPCMMMTRCSTILHWHVTMYDDDKMQYDIQIVPYHMNHPCNSRTLHGPGFDSYGMARSVSSITESWNLKHETLKDINYPDSMHQEPTYPPRIQPGDGG